jgi:hypothetical protein|nr:hypothetical protein [Kofleriaceae bacterium]
MRIWVLALLAACAHGKSGGASPTTTTLVMLPTESDSHPSVASAATDALAHAKIAGVGETVTSKVSIEVVQLSIECVDATAACYGAAAKSLSAGKLLFAQVDDDERGQPRVTVTLFDAAAGEPRASKRAFDSEAAAVAGVQALVSEVTR